MTAANFNLRGISPQIMLRLKREAKELKISVNQLILKFVEQGVDLNAKPKRLLHHDLDHLAGGWSKQESTAFEKRLEIFEKIDEELWK